MSSRWLFVLPLLMALLLGGFFGYALLAGRSPEEIGSPLVGKPAPSIDLAPLHEGGKRLAAADWRGQVSVVNFFASWCAPCQVEHPLLMRMARDGVRVQGVNYKNKPEDAKPWLARLGDPYERIGVDADGKAGVEFGLSGVPETFVIDRAGIVRLHLRRPLTPDDAQRIRALVKELAK
ncbi:MAG: DsbE family thiol:disulfide interchange protein [Alphaproteobacteria bacterium]|nr:DsbE family thiol:disulfide interchange protein [Alphaproteobacteria bacterium]MCW5743368.1 DsbE family thiol:disulfide interchange protein [Alphaproteobacteria bacterium]